MEISSRDFPISDRVEAFRETFGRVVLNVDIEPLVGQDFDVRIALRALPGIGLAIGTVPAANCRHRPNYADNDDIVLSIIESSDGLLEQDGRAIEVGNGQAVLTAHGEDATWRTFQQATRLSHFRFERSRLLRSLQGRTAALRQVIPQGNPALQLLKQYASIFADTDPLAKNPDLRSTVVDHFYDLAALAFGATSDAAEIAQGRGVRAARLRAIKADITQHITSSLSVETIASRHGVSTAYVRKLLNLDGTSFADFVLRQRLAWVHHRLVDWRWDYFPISTIAFEAGFGDLSYFNRTFRRAYGATPSDVREMAKSSRISQNR